MSHSLEPGHCTADMARPAMSMIMPATRNGTIATVAAYQRLFRDRDGQTISAKTNRVTASIQTTVSKKDAATSLLEGIFLVTRENGLARLVDWVHHFLQQDFPVIRWLRSEINPSQTVLEVRYAEFRDFER